MRLRFFRTNRLGTELRQKQVSEAEKLGYFLLTGLIGTVFGGGGSIRLLSQGHGWAILGVTLFIYLVGVIWVFGINQDGDGQSFLERFICLSVSAHVRMLLLAYGSYYLLALAVPTWVAARRMSLSVVLAMLSMLAYYRWIGGGMALAAGTETTER